MKKNLVTILAIFIIPLVLFGVLSRQSEQVSAKTSNSQIQTEVTGKPQVLKFTSSMCRDCQTMNGIFKEIFPKYNDSIVLTEIHVQNKSSFNGEMMKKYKVELVPTIILVNSDGNVVERIEGAISKDEMDNKLKGLK
mgnify:CR=1 FL=1